MRHPFLGTIIGQCQHRAAIDHQFFGPLRHGGKGIARDQQRIGEIVLRGLDIAPGELVLVGKSDAMHDEIEAAPVLSDILEHGIDGRRIGDIAMADHIGTQFGGQRTHALFQSIALEREGQLRACGMAGLGNAPGNRAVVGDAHHKAALAAQDGMRQERSLGRICGFGHGYLACSALSKAMCMARHCQCRFTACKR